MLILFLVLVCFVTIADLRVLNALLFPVGGGGGGGQKSSKIDQFSPMQRSPTSYLLL